MVDNQHKKINGYRDLSEEEISLMNEAKEVAEVVRIFVDKVQSKTDGSDLKVEIDPRWLATGRTDLQKGFMSIIRSIARPTTF